MSEIKKVEENRAISDNVNLKMTIDHIDGEKLDTEIVVQGTWWVAGGEREEFAKKLGDLIDEYRI